MVNEVDLGSKDYVLSLGNIEEFTVSSFYKCEKKNETIIFIAVNKSLL